VNEEQTILSAGWYFYEKCRCSGIIKYKYRNKVLNSLELEWWAKRSMFKVTYRGSSTKIPPTSVMKLEKTLNELKEEYAVA